MKLMMVVFLATFSYSDGKNYYEYSDREKYQDAVKFCENLGKEIATATTKEDYSDLETFCESNCRSDSYWIGLGFNFTERRFQWSDGTFMDFKEWDENEPNRQNAERCAYMRFGGMKWRTTSCSTGLPFVCVDFSENPKYTFYTDEFNHDDASKRCLQNNGVLPIIRTPTDQQNLEKFLNTQSIPWSQKIWIGLKKLTNDDRYRWIDGEDLKDFYSWSTEDWQFNYVHIHYSSSLYLHSTSDSERYIICQDTTIPVKKKTPTNYFVKESNHAYPLGQPRRIFIVEKTTSCAGMCSRDIGCAKYTLKQSICTTYGDVFYVIGSGGSPLFKRREP